MYEVHLKKFGRFGNNAVQLINAIHFCRSHRARLHVTGLEALQDDLVLDFSDGGECDQLIRDFTFYDHRYPQERQGLPGYELPDHRERRELALAYLAPLTGLDDFDPPDYDLIVNIRSGSDVIQAPGLEPPGGGIRMPPVYVQPPLALYQKVISENGFQRVAIVTMADMINPCVAGLVEWRPDIEVLTPEPRVAFRLLGTAKQVAFGYSTFSSTAVLASGRVQDIFVPERRYYPYAPRGSASVSEPGLYYSHCHMHEYRMPGYPEVGEWGRTGNVMEWMLEYERERIQGPL